VPAARLILGLFAQGGFGTEGVKLVISGRLFSISESHVVTKQPDLREPYTQPLLAVAGPQVLWCHSLSDR
jgi:hypothetical protein